MTDKIDTSPEALLALADKIDSGGFVLMSYIARGARTLAAEKSAWTAREAELEHQLRNLLAIIFRDGGQRAAAYPTLAEAVEAAHLEWANLVRERDQALDTISDLSESSEQTAVMVSSQHQALERRAEQADADAAALRRALISHGEHDATCRRHPRHDTLGACDCGFDAALSSTAGRDLLARMERMRTVLVKLHHVVTCHVIEYTNARALRDAVAEAKAALADQPGERE